MHATVAQTWPDSKSLQQRPRRLRLHQWFTCQLTALSIRKYVTAGIRIQMMSEQEGIGYYDSMWHSHRSMLTFGSTIWQQATFVQVDASIFLKCSSRIQVFMPSSCPLMFRVVMYMYNVHEDGTCSILCLNVALSLKQINIRLQNLPSIAQSSSGITIIVCYNVCCQYTYVIMFSIVHEDGK